LSDEVKPVSCNSENIDEIAKVSEMTHLAIIKGVPTRLIAPGWYQGSEEPPFDFFLAYFAYKDDLQVGSFNSGDYSYDGRESDRLDFQPRSPLDGYVRHLNVSYDKMFAFGRIEEVTRERTFDLIDRTLVAEGEGVRGNFLLGLHPSYVTEGTNYYNTFNFLLDLTSSRREECINYLTSNTNPWPYENCRVGATRSGNIPGESGTNINKVVNAGLYLGTEPWPNGQSGFDGFNNMLKWQKDDSDCTTLCRDFVSPVEEDDCRQNSLDYFKEINTDCVGGNNLIGFQLRSFPVQYMGFWPAGWKSWNGQYEGSVPVVLSGDSFKNERFLDDNYLRIGSVDTVEDPECLLEDGSVESCEEILAPNLYIDFNLDEPIEFGESREFNYKFRYKKPEAVGAKLRYGVYDIYDGNMYGLETGTIDFLFESNDWEIYESNFIVENTHVELIEKVRLSFLTLFSSGAKKWVELDGVELTDLSNNQEIIAVDYGSFNKEHIGFVNGGDWASNVIARLGGIAWWGSSSHYLTGGWAFGDTYKFPGAFYSGRSLGESLAYTNRAYSGIIYGDPLYRPSGVKIFINNKTALVNREEGYDFTFTSVEDGEILINAFHGQDNSDTKYSLEVCYKTTLNLCSESGNWTLFESGNGQMFNEGISTGLYNLLPGNVDQFFIIKLTVSNEGDEENGLTNYAYFNYSKSEDGFLGDVIDPVGDALCGPVFCGPLECCIEETCLECPVNETVNDTTVPVVNETVNDTTVPVDSGDDPGNSPGGSSRRSSSSVSSSSVGMANSSVNESANNSGSMSNGGSGTIVNVSGNSSDGQKNGSATRIEKETPFDFDGIGKIIIIVMIVVIVVILIVVIVTLIISSRRKSKKMRMIAMKEVMGYDNSQ